MEREGRALSVIGAGYVGLVTAVGLAERGHTVTLVERNPDKLASLFRGEVPLFEPGLQEAFSAQVAEGRIQVADALERADGVVMVCAGTPIGDDGRGDLSQVQSVLAGLPVNDSTILVLRSTMPVGSSRGVAGWTSVPTSRTFSNPEFLRQGSALQDFREPSRVVIGRFDDADPDALATVRDVVASKGAPVLVVDITASEMIKNGANAMLALKLSFANELANLAESVGTDVGDVLEGIAADPRIGRAYMRPSFGFGGSCLPKELRTFTVAGQAFGLPMHVAAAASLANDATQERFISRISSIVGGLSGRRIGVLGLAFKSDTDDVRHSPALRLVASMLARGAIVRAYDPAAMPNARAELPALETAADAGGVFEGADAVVIATEWPEFRGLPYGNLRSAMRSPVLIDGRRLLDLESLAALGFEVHGVGRGAAVDRGAPEPLVRS